MADEPTDRQLELLRAIITLSETCGFAPTIRELGDRVGIDSTNGVTDHLVALRKKGLVDWIPNKARTLRATGLGLTRGRAA